jgi:hypothetical protein
MAEEAIAKMDELRKKILERLRGKSSTAAVTEAIVNNEPITQAQLETVANDLQTVMQSDQTFASEIHDLASQTVYGYFRHWRITNTWQDINAKLQQLDAPSDRSLTHHMMRMKELRQHLRCSRLRCFNIRKLL